MSPPTPSRPKCSPQRWQQIPTKSHRRESLLVAKKVTQKRPTGIVQEQHTTNFSDSVRLITTTAGQPLPQICLSHHRLRSQVKPRLIQTSLSIENSNKAQAKISFVWNHLPSKPPLIVRPSPIHFPYRSLSIWVIALKRNCLKPCHQSPKVAIAPPL